MTRRNCSMMANYQTLVRHVCVFFQPVQASMKIQVLLLAFWIASVSDSTRPANFQLGPNGEDCIRSGSDMYYDHIDENGLRCHCLPCIPGKILTKNCICAPNSEQQHESECGLVPRGQFMNSSNICSRGFECKTCPHPLRVKNNCSHHGPDTVCSCADGYYMTSPDTCLPFPKCGAGYEPTPGYGHHGTKIRCTPCHEGFFQPNNNSTLTCKKIRQCTVQEGTPRLDAVCLNDQTLEPTHQPTNDYETTTDSTESDKPGVTTPVPTSHDETTSVGPTTHLTTNNPGVPKCEPCHQQWNLVNFFSYNLHGFLWGILLCHARNIWKFVRSICQRGTYVLAGDRSEEEKNAVDEMEGVAEHRV